MKEECLTCVLSDCCRMTETEAAEDTERCDELIRREHEERKAEYAQAFAEYLQLFEESL